MQGGFELVRKGGHQMLAELLHLGFSAVPKDFVKNQ